MNKATSASRVRRHEAPDLRPASPMKDLIRYPEDVALIVNWKDRTLVNCSAGISEALGYKPEELIGRSTEILHLDRDHFEEFGRLAFGQTARNETVRMKFPLRRRDGSRFEAEHILIPIPGTGDDGEGALVVNVMADLGRRHDAEAIADLLTDFDPVAISLVRIADGRVLRANPRFYDLFRVPPGAESKMTTVDIFPDPETRSSIVRRINAEGVVSDAELEARRFDGTKIWTSLYVKLTRWLGQDVLFGVIVDITERKLAEERLAASEARFRDLAGLTADWFWETDMDQRYTYLTSSNAFEGAGIDAGEWIGRTRGEAHERIGTEGDFAGAIQPHMDRGEPFFDVRHRFVHPARGETWLSVSGTPFRDQAGALIGYRGIGRNVTAAVQADRRLRESENLLRAFIDNAPATIYLKDLEGRYLIVNRKLQNFLHQFSDRVEGQQWADFYPPRAAEIYAAQDREVVATGQAHEYEVEAAIPGREEHVLHITKFPVLDADGRIAAIGGINVDVTTQRRLEQQLVHAQKLDAIGRLTGGVAHDFNNLLAVILGSAELLVDEIEDNPRLKKAAQAIEHAAERGAELTRRLLAFSRQQDLRPRQVDVRSLLVGLRDLFARTLGDDIDVVIACDDDVRPVRADIGQLENVILNLAVNARDAMPDGGRLAIGAENIDLDDDLGAFEGDFEPGRYVRVTVADAGVGMAPEVLAKAFDPFFTTKDVDKGTGLGLSIVYGFVKQSGGHVHIDSAPGEGTVVSLYLPAEAAAEDAATGQAAGDLPGGRECVLVVEDNVLVRDYVAATLRRLGYDVRTAKDGDGALALIDDGAPADLLLTDVVMPGGMYGHEIAERARGKLPALKVLFTTGYRDPAQFGCEVEPRHLLRKPHHKGELARRVRRRLDED